jgi:hypothetical protein
MPIRKKHDPIRNLEMFAEGDVVGLGLMTAAEFKDKGLKNKKTGNWIREPGRMIAASLIPPAMRFAAEKELAPFREAKRAATTILQGPDGQPLQAGPRVTIMLPPNGREAKESK